MRFSYIAVKKKSKWRTLPHSVSCLDGLVMDGDAGLQHSPIELCAGSELVSRLEAKQRVGARGDALADRMAGRFDTNSHRLDAPESRWRDAVPPVAPPIRRDSLRTALLFLAGPATTTHARGWWWVSDGGKTCLLQGT